MLFSTYSVVHLLPIDSLSDIYELGTPISQKSETLLAQ